MVKNLLTMLLSMVLIFALALPANAEVFLEDGYQLYEPDEVMAEKQTDASADGFPVSVRAKSFVLMDATSGKVLLENNSHEKLYPASVTKIMSMLLVAEAIDNGDIYLTDEVSASTNASSKGGSQIWLREGETMTVKDLLKATAVYSANDACTALGEHVAGSSEAFVNRMNERAAELSMKDTHFENCTGLDDDTTEHLTTAHDIALMSRELLTHTWIQEYTTIWMDSLRGGQTELVNTNKLVRFYDGTTGLKTGTTNKAGCCISASAKRGDTHLVAVVMGCANSKDRFEGAKSLLSWGFSNFETICPEIDRKQIAPVNVLKGVETKIKPQVPGTMSVLIPKGKAGEIKQEINLSVDVQAPVEQGQVLGTVTLTLSGETIGVYNLTAPHPVEKLTIPIIFCRLLGTFAR